jgi:aminomethyltransferase
LVAVTQLYDEYRSYASLTDFAGYRMPLSFKGIIKEHLAVRENAGFFDVSHMGRFVVEGRQADAFLNRLLTADVVKAEPGRANYALMCYENGGVIDDLITYKVDSDKFFVVVNAGNRQKDFEWMTTWARDYDVSLRDVTLESVLIAVQGPKSADLLRFALGLDVSGIKRFHFALTTYEGRELLVGRTGYTGEDGYEIMLSGVTAERPEGGRGVWSRLMEEGRRTGVEPCGLGARDTLRLEAGLPLYGNELTAETTPIEASLARFVDVNKDDYLGKTIHTRQLNAGTTKSLQGLVCVERGIPRSHNTVLLDGVDVGFVTSGTFSPLLRQGIALAYIRSKLGRDAREFTIDIRGTKCKAEIHPPPFYDPERYGWRRKTV